MTKEQWVDDLLGKMSLEEKIGQLMVFGFAGPVIYPHTRELIKKYHIGGFRISQKFHPGSSESRGKQENPGYKCADTNTFDVPQGIQTKRINCTPEEYAAVLNTLRDLALDRKNSIGLHFAYDQEGEGADFLFRQRLFPYPMGIVAAGNPQMAYDTAYASGKQAHALGANLIHSPVLDVNTNPDNPEIGPRAYSSDPDVVIEYALKSLKGYNDAGIACTGKHFPGRGASDTDAHFSLPAINLSREEMFEVHLKPYKALIDNGLQCIMAAFTAYPGLGEADVPAAASRAIITGILRGELGFKGVITTDNAQMRGLLDKYEIGEAAVKCLLAGCDLILFRSESPATIYVIEKVLEAVKNGKYPESMLDESIKRILAMRYNMGLHINGGKVDAGRAGELFEDSFIVKTANDAAVLSTKIVKNNDNVIPVDKNKKVLLIEQIHHYHSFINSTYVHAGVLWEEMRKYSDNVSVAVINESYTDHDKQAVLKRLSQDDYDVIVTTSYYNYRSHACMIDLLKDIAAYGKPVIAVANTPYEKFGMPDFINNGIVNFCPSGRENIAAIAKAIFTDQTPFRQEPSPG